MLIKMILNTISLITFFGSLFYLFVPEKTLYGSYNYTFSLIFYLVAFFTASIRNNDYSKVLLVIYSLSLIAITIGLTNYLFDIQGKKLSAFFHCLYIGIAAWISFFLIFLKIKGRFFANNGTRIKVLSIIIVISILSYMLLRYSKTAWEIFDNEIGTQWVWMILGNVILLLGLIVFVRIILKERINNSKPPSVI